MIDSGQPIRDTEPLNWVRRRGQCTIRGVFGCLAEQVKRDLRERQSLPPPHPRTRYSFNDIGADKFSVVLEYGRDDRWNAERATDFRLSKDFICISTQHDDSFCVFPQWNHATATCELYVDNERYDLWQVSQKALYDLFFPPE